MTTQRELEARLSRMEATRPRKTEAERHIHRMLHAMSLADLGRLEGLMMRAESGEPSAALTTSEQEWLDATMKQVGFPDAS